MTYTKPEINLLGDAAELIQNLGKFSGVGDPSIPPFVDPAYDLDE